MQSNGTSSNNSNLSGLFPHDQERLFDADDLAVEDVVSDDQHRRAVVLVEVLQKLD